MDQFIYVITGTIIAATPLIYAGLGELVVEKSGVLNLGIEGMMLIGAVVAFFFVKNGYPHAVAIVGALVAGAASSVLFGVLALTFLTNQYAAGLALAIFGAGVSGSVGRNFGSAPIVALKPLQFPLLSDIPVLGSLLFGFDYLVYLAFVAVGLVTWVLYRTKTGLIDPHGRRIATIRACHRLSGDPYPLSDHAIRRRDGGFGGAYLSIAYTPLWVENMTAGKGWIALALVVFSTWRPLRLMLGAWLFGGMTILQLEAQATGLPIPSDLLTTLPYIATIVVLVVISRNRQLLLLNFPASLAKPFRPSD